MQSRLVAASHVRLLGICLLASTWPPATACSPEQQTDDGGSGGTAMGGAAGAGIATGGIATGGAAGAPPCPGTGGPVMVRLPEGYCIDTTEVTRAQYRAWLDTNPSTAGQFYQCTWNTGFTPDATCMGRVCQTDCDNHPQPCVDWCDAYAYCEAVGKRLCGKIGGGSNAFSAYANASLSQWYNACTSHGACMYPYGDTGDDQACNGYDYSGTDHMTVAVGSMSTCQSNLPGYSGVYDLSGNLTEWEDSCDLYAGDYVCRQRGGPFRYGTSDLSCGCDAYYYSYETSDFVGFRCCSSP